MGRVFYFLVAALLAILALILLAPVVVGAQSPKVGYVCSDNDAQYVVVQGNNISQLKKGPVSFVEETGDGRLVVSKDAKGMVLAYIQPASKVVLSQDKCFNATVAAVVVKAVAIPTLDIPPTPKAVADLVVQHQKPTNGPSLTLILLALVGGVLTVPVYWSMSRRGI